MKRVVVGLSGGVDSSVAAYLLQQKGYDVIGLFMKNWHNNSVTISNKCAWIEDSNDAMSVAEDLKIPFQTIDLSKEYKEKIVDYMFDEYERGRTPNPDILCNREIKFDIFLRASLQLNADYVATGHYCRKESLIYNKKEIFRLLPGIDKNKDQSYFLCQLKQSQLKNILFPIGHLNKSEVRKIANKLNLITAKKKDSQGLCFIGKVKLPNFLQQKLQQKNGDIIEIKKEHPIFKSNKKFSKEENSIEAVKNQSMKYKFQKNMGKKVGNHNGAHYFTIGQRKGLNIGGKEKPLFVIGTDTKENIIYVGQGCNHPGLYRTGLKIEKKDIHWIREEMKIKPGENKEVFARIRYRQKLQKAILYQTKSDMYIIFKSDQKAISAGQFTAWYIDNELVGSGVIS